jgi:hypothetical protein
MESPTTALKSQVKAATDSIKTDFLPSPVKSYPQPWRKGIIEEKSLFC